jgi:hypothetical protein
MYPHVSIKHPDLFHNWSKHQCNEISIKTCKSILEMPRRTSALIELYEPPAYLDAMVNMITFWVRMDNMDKG